jgi:hypothetical protein
MCRPGLAPIGCTGHFAAFRAVVPAWWFGSKSVFQTSISFGPGRKQHRFQREQNLFFFAIPG